MGKAAHLAASDIAVVLSELSTLLVDESDRSALLHRVVETAKRAVGGCDGASVSLVQEGKAWTAVASSAEVLAVDEAQYLADEGPCLAAYRERRIVRVDLDAAEQEWPHFAESARAIGVRSFLAAPLRVSSETLGALNLFSESTAGFDALDETFLGLLTSQAATVITNSLRYASVKALADQLAEAMVSRAVIEQAKGVLIALHGFDPDEAFDALRRESQRTNTKLRDVATRLVTRARAQAKEQRPPRDPVARPPGTAVH